MKKTAAFLLAAVMVVPATGICARAADPKIDPDDVVVESVNEEVYDRMMQFTAKDTNSNTYDKEINAGAVKKDTRYQMKVATEVVQGATKNNGAYVQFKLDGGKVYDTQSKYKNTGDKGVNTYDFYANDKNCSTCGLQYFVRFDTASAENPAIVRFGYTLEELFYKVTAGENVSVTSEYESPANGSDGNYATAGTDVTFTVTDGYAPSVTVGGENAAATKEGGSYKVTATGPVVIEANPICTITVTEAGTPAAKYENVEYNQKVTVSETDEQFSYWEKDGKIVSYDKTYSFFAYQDVTVNAVLNGPVEAKPVCNLTYDRNGDTTEIYVEYTCPESVVVNGELKTGVYIAKEESGWTWESRDDKLFQPSFGKLGQFKVTVTGAGEHPFWVQGYCNINNVSYDTDVRMIAAE